MCDSRCRMWLEHSFTLLFAHFVNITDVSYPSPSLTQCSYACLRKIGCSSFFYNRKKHVCHISTKRYLNSEGLAVDSEYAYFIMRPGYDCPLGFDKQGSSCYFFSTWNDTYSNATKNCSRLGSHLAVITSKEENDVLRNYARTLGKAERYFIGATYRRQEGIWFWENFLRAMDYANWAPGEPNDDYGVEDCLELRKPYDYKWNDVPCTVNGNFICETEL